MPAALLQIIGSDNVDLCVLYASLLLVFLDLNFASPYSATRQACSVFLKNRVANSYALDPARAHPDNRNPIAPSDRAALKSSVLPLLSESPSRAITVQLASTLKTLVSHDFPDRWPELMPNAKQMLASTNIRELGAGCIVVLEMIRAFR